MCGVIVVDAESFRSTRHGHDANIHVYRAGYKLELHQIPTNTPQKSLHQIDLQED